MLSTPVHRYLSWFLDAKTNVSFSAVDIPAFAADKEAVAYEVVRVNDHLLKKKSADDQTNRLTRSELLRTVLMFIYEIRPYFSIDVALSRAYVHAETGLEQVVVCHAFARMAMCYTCTALDTSDESLKHRFLEFNPIMIVASSDSLSGPMHETAAARCIRLFKAVPCYEIFRGAAEAWTVQTPRYTPPGAVDDSHVLMVVFTSGSTGKPKGLVHGHGGYGSCVSRSMSYVFNARPGVDIFLTLATFAWITGQSYMLYGPALAECASLLIEGSPLGADGLRWARLAKVRGATILKCASAFARQVMGDRSRRRGLEELDLPNSSLRMGTFCAEPVSTDVQQWASRHVVAPFLNSYWATEHGSIVMSRDPRGKYQPDTRCWPVPWVKPSIVRQEKNSLGDFVIDVPYAGLARTVFGNHGEYGGGRWRGDLKRFKTAYFPSPTSTGEFNFVQGDAARIYENAFTFHGRRDEVLNVLGVRVGIEELEKVAWGVSDSQLQDLAIVGAPDTLKGQVPIGWVAFSDGATKCDGLVSRWRSALRNTIGVYAEPSMIIAVAKLPKTTTGKTQRGLLQAALCGKASLHPSAAASAVADVHSYADCYRAAQEWRLCEATSVAVPLHVLPAWKQFGFDGHDIGGSPLLPATGWLYILSQTLSHAPTGLQKVQLMQGIRDFEQSLILRKHTRTAASVENNVGVVVLKCEFLKCSLIASGILDIKAWTRNASAAVLDDIDGEKHYHRCAVVALRYSGHFRCVKRVVWRADWSFRARVLVTTVPALLDAALQIVCTMDALSRGVAFIPFSIETFHLASNLENYCLEDCFVVGKLTQRDDSRLECSFAFYTASNKRTSAIFTAMQSSSLVAIMEGVKFVGVDNIRPIQPPPTLLSSSPSSQSSSVASSRCLTEQDDASVLRKIVSLGSDLIGSTLDPSKSLFENGLHSLRAVELIGKLNQTYGVSLSAIQITPGEDTLRTISTSLRSALDARDYGCKSSRFAHVDHDALQRIVNARLTGVEASDLRYERRRSAVAEAARGVTYMIRRGALKYLRIQHRDGLFRFLLSIPACINLDRIVIVPGTQVHFEQTDYNRHFTVREIIRDSERGFYNLIHASGLAHLEHYYRVMFYASRLEARFDAELLEGEKYEMRGRVTSITGPLVDTEVAFYSLRKPNVQAFVVTWRLMLVIDPRRKLMYDFERGGTFGDGNAIPETQVSRVRSETWTLTRRGKFITSGSIAFFSVLVGLYAMAPVAVRILIPVPLVVADVLKGLRPQEAIIIFAALGLWLRTHPGQEPLDGPVDMLLPHG